MARGAEIIERELKRALILPRPAECIRSILRMLDAAYELLRQPTDDRNPYAVAAGVSNARAPATTTSTAINRFNISI